MKPLYPLGEKEGLLNDFKGLLYKKYPYTKTWKGL